MFNILSMRCLLLFTLFCMTGEILGQVVDIEGFMPVTSLSREGPTRTNPYCFKVTYSNELFRLKVDNKALKSMWECVYDGKDIYLLSDVEKEPQPIYLSTTNKPFNIPRLTNNSAPLFAGNTISIRPISSDAIPYTHGHLGILWLAFCSSNYLYSHTNMPPLWLRDDPTLYYNGWKDQIHSYRDSETNMFLSVYFISDGYYRWRKNKISLSRPYPPPYNRGFTNAVFKWKAYTNLAGFIIPIECSLTITNNPMDGDSLYCNSVFLFITTNINILDTNINLTLLSSNWTTVTDTRIVGNASNKNVQIPYHSLRYNITNRPIYSGTELTNAISKNESLLLIIAEHKLLSKQRRTRRNFFLLFSIFLVSVPFAFVAIKHYKRSVN